MKQKLGKMPQKPNENGVKRHNICMDEATRKRAEELAELDKRSVSNLLAVLVDREWERLKRKEAIAA